VAVVSAAVAAVTALATVGVTAGTVATAVVAVSTLIGTVGLAVTAVGMITKNEGLLKAGKIMGYVGLAGNIAGWGTGIASMGGNEFAAHVGELYKTSWEQGVGSFFAPDPGVAGAQQEALGRGIVAASNPDYAQNVAASSAGMNQEALGQGIKAGTPMPPSTMTQPTVTASGPQPIANADPNTPALVQGGSSDAGAQPLAEQSLAQQTAVSTQAPVTPVVPADAAAAAGAQQEALGHSIVKATQGALPSPTSPGFWDRLPDYVKYSLMTTGGQGAAGLASGWFQGLSAEERLALEKEIANRNEAQRQLENRNAAYSPRLTFKKPTGIIGAAGRPA